jgi:hypothetical protein
MNLKRQNLSQFYKELSENKNKSNKYIYIDS